MRLVLSILLLLIPLMAERGHAVPVFWAELCDGHTIALDGQGKPIPDRHCPDCLPGALAIPVDVGRMPEGSHVARRADVPHLRAMRPEAQGFAVRARGPPARVIHSQPYMKG